MSALIKPKCHIIYFLVVAYPHIVVDTITSAFILQERFTIFRNSISKKIIPNTKLVLTIYNQLTCRFLELNSVFGLHLLISVTLQFITVFFHVYGMLGILWFDSTRHHLKNILDYGFNVVLDVFSLGYLLHRCECLHEEYKHLDDTLVEKTIFTDVHKVCLKKNSKSGKCT